MASGAPILLYDGVCGLCHRLVRFVLRRDRAGRIRFAALQSPFAASVLARHGRDPGALDTMYLLLDAGSPRERLLGDSDGVLTLLRELGGVWALLSWAQVLPRGPRDRAYGWLVRNRYRWFGRYDQCPLPPPELRQRFADQTAAEPRERAAAGPHVDR